MARLEHPTPVIERLKEAIELLESIAADRSVLAGVPDEERKRLLQAVANVYSPDRVERRRMSKIVDRQRKAARVKGDQGVLQETGIRSLRRKPVFHTPNVFPTVSIADGFTPDDVQAESPSPEPRAASCSTATSASRSTRRSITSTISCVPACAELNFAKRTELADLRGRVALLTGGRVKIGYQAGLKLLRCGAHLIVTTRFPRDSAARYARGAGLRRLGPSPRDLRPRPAAHAERRSVLPRAAGDHARRLDFIVNNACQTVRRPPDFYAHMMEGETAALHDMPEHVRKLLGSYEGLRGYHLLPEGGARGETRAESGSAGRRD